MNLQTLGRVVTTGILLSSMAACAKKDKKPSGDTVSASKATTPNTPPTTPEPPAKIEKKANGDEWIPQEHQLGMKKFKDPGVYVDGKLVGVLAFGELPIGLPVLWHEEEAAIEFKAGQKGPRTKIVKQRRYSIQKYLKAVGVDLKKVKELHIYGGAKRAVAITVTGDKLRKHPKFAFRFGSDVFGKPIPGCPPDIADGNCPDNLRAIAVYIDKPPPTRKGGYFYFGDKLVEGIPYFGQPLRGGIRVYTDNVFAAQIKRHKLADNDASFKFKLPDGSTRYRFLEFVKAQDVDVSTITEGWLIQRDRWVKKFTRKELEDLTFATAPRGSGSLLVGPDRIRTNAIHLHTKPVNPKDIAVPEPHELHDDRKN